MPHPVLSVRVFFNVVIFFCILHKHVYIELAQLMISGKGFSCYFRVILLIENYLNDLL